MYLPQEFTWMGLELQYTCVTYLESENSLRKCEGHNSRSSRNDNNNEDFFKGTIILWQFFFCIIEIYTL
jgi:hypothetical protein